MYSSAEGRCLVSRPAFAGRLSRPSFGEGLDLAVDDAFPRARLEVTTTDGRFELRFHQHGLLRPLGAAELWAVVKADAYGHGALDCARAALGAGAAALCVATLEEALDLRGELTGPRIVVMGPTAEIEQAREARLELCVADEIPDDIPVHVKLDTGMGRWGASDEQGNTWAFRLSPVKSP